MSEHGNRAGDDRSLRTSAEAGPENRVRRAVEELRAELAARLDQHPWRRHLRSHEHEVELSLRIPVGGGRTLEEAARRAERAIDDAVARLVAQHATFRPGRVPCLRCGTADCRHAVPETSRQVFAGYGPSGLPRFVDLQQLLVERRDERVDRLFARPPRLLTLTLDEETLHRELLPSHRRLDAGFRLHGQICAGWYDLPRAEGLGGEVLALSFQLLSNAQLLSNVSSSGSGPAEDPGGDSPNADSGRDRPLDPAPRGPLRLALNVLGASPDGGPLEHVVDRFADASPPWGEALQWARRALADVERGARARDTEEPGGDRAGLPVWERRALGVLAGLERRLQRQERSTRRRTVHAEERRQVQRPVGRAIAELEGARPEDVLWDRRRQTLVVLGERGRAHVWSPEGRLVTSIHFTAEAVERRIRRGRWRRAPQEQVETLRERVAAGTGR
jgi:hypothetical protein